MTEAISDSKLSRRQFVGAAAAGAAALGAVAGGKALVPQIATASPTSDSKALDAAGAKAQPLGIPSSWDYTADVVIVGFGGAGAAAAITAHDAGSSVLVLEKDPIARMGISGMCGGQVFSPVLAANGGSVQDFITYHKMIHWGTIPDDALITAVCNGVATWPAWIASLGGTTMYSPAVSSVPRSLVTGFVNPSFQSKANWESYCFSTLTGSTTGAKGTGVDTMYFLRNCVEARNIPVMLATPAQKLIQDPNTKEILGVTAVDWKGATLNIQANKGVILACGGHENNPEMTNNFLPWGHSQAQDVTFWGTPYNTGDGITMAQSVGAKLWHMNNKEWVNGEYGCLAASKEFGYGFGVSVANSCIVVNRYGQRFMNEHASGSGHTAQIYPIDTLVENIGLSAGYTSFDPRFNYLPATGAVPLPASAAAESVGPDYVDYPNYPFYMIFDSTRMKAGALSSGGWPGLVSLLHPAGTQSYTWSSDNSVELAKGWIQTGPDPTTLGNSIVCYDFFGRVVGMSGSGLAATITQYNTDCAAGKGDTVWGRPAASMLPLTNPPYYAMQLVVGSLNTNGGPVHDQYGRTIDVYNNPIPRLYTIGELGSIFGFLYHSGGNFPEAMNMGRISGAHASSLPSRALNPSS
ncbi:MAG: FAD-binding protein [Nitrososphaerales archaeon]